jgi:hypothetical protein
MTERFPAIASAATEAASVKFLIDGESAETENRHVVAGKPLFDERRTCRFTALTPLPRCEP